MGNVLAENLQSGVAIVKMQQARRQQEVVKAIEKLRGRVEFDYQRGSVAPNSPPLGPMRL